MCPNHQALIPCIECVEDTLDAVVAERNRYRQALTNIKRICTPTMPEPRDDRRDRIYEIARVALNISAQQGGQQQ
jgi:hypothetical protein